MERRVPQGQGFTFAIGPLDMSVYRTKVEWHLACGSTASLEDEADRGRVEPISAPPEDAEVLERYTVSAGRNSLRCVPLLADRSVVVRARIPLFVPPREEIRIYVSSPVWIRLEVGEPWQTLRELAVKRLSDTWFGSSTRDGDLAYALRSHARVQLEDVPIRYHRAITPVVVRNQAEDMLSVDRLNLPVPYLSLFATSANRLWTEAATMTREGGNDLAALKIRQGAPPEAGSAQRICEPRKVAESSLLVRAFSELFNSLAKEDS